MVPLSIPGQIPPGFSTAAAVEVVIQLLGVIQSVMFNRSIWHAGKIVVALTALPEALLRASLRSVMCEGGRLTATRASLKLETASGQNPWCFKSYITWFVTMDT